MTYHLSSVLFMFCFSVLKLRNVCGVGSRGRSCAAAAEVVCVLKKPEEEERQRTNDDVVPRW